MSYGGHWLGDNLRGAMSCDGTSGTSSAKTTAKPLGDALHQSEYQHTTKGITDVFKCQLMWQWKSHGPGLFVKNRIVTSSPAIPALTTSRITESLKLYDELPAVRTT